MTLIDDLIAAAQAEPRKFVNLIRITTELIEKQDQQQAETERQTNIDLALQWWQTIKPNTITSREQALSIYKNIEDRIKTESDKWRIYILREKLKEAEINFIDAKKGNLPITVV